MNLKLLVAVLRIQRPRGFRFSKMKVAPHSKKFFWGLFSTYFPLLLLLIFSFGLNGGFGSGKYLRI